jgi:ATP-dependent Clp endopeptidase proteolytic subunit ClpP
MIEYIYTIDPSADEPIMLLNKHIGYDNEEGMGIIGSQFQAELLSLDAMGKKCIKIYINSIGGNVMEGMSIYDAILRAKSSVDTYCIGVAASTAGWIFTAGKNRYISDYGLVMLHDPYVNGSEDESLTKFRDSIITMIAARVGKEAFEVSKMMNDTTWLDADNALSNGFATEILPSDEFNKKRVKSEDTIKNKWIMADKIVNSLEIKNKNKDMSLNKIANVLSLNEDATAESIISSITNLIKIKNEMDTSGEEFNSLKNKLEVCMNALNEAENKLAEYENKMKETEMVNKINIAKEMVNSFVKLGKIKNEETSIDKWLNLATLDFDMAKSMLDEIPVNVVTPSTKIPQVGATNKAVVNSNGIDEVAKRMSEIRDMVAKSKIK